MLDTKIPGYILYDAWKMLGENYDGEVQGRISADLKISLPAERRKEETNISLEYNSDMKKARLHSTLVALLNDPMLADLKDLKQAVRKRIDDTIGTFLGMLLEMLYGYCDFVLLELAHASRHVWSKFCLLFHNEKLLDDTAKLQDYGIRNNAQIIVISCYVDRLWKLAFCSILLRYS
ncbi:hypothetical protein RND71_022157 [Anisodus tanguticus]|uniref:SNRNP25 ubiquitin-like domain-containing protein n=1 Tax=Anisodus tanguticus TaxID=243964 RepID=A0AAE1RZH4_9SOLA|nr:hypothetical protein RND71_022157 [Anisodus tanguticus]